MTCKRCGTEEGRINGYCSAYCRDVAGLEGQIERLKDQVTDLDWLVDQLTVRAERAEAENERLKQDLKWSRLECSMVVESSFQHIAEAEDRADRLAVMADALASDRIEGLVKEKALQNYFAMQDRAEKAEAELAAAKERERALREALLAYMESVGSPDWNPSSQEYRFKPQPNASLTNTLKHNLAMKAEQALTRKDD
jgi:chromosome segregation ATPase